MQQSIIGIAIMAAFIISPLLVIKCLLNYAEKNPQRVVAFQLKLLGCNVVLTLSDENEKIQPERKKVSIRTAGNRIKTESPETRISTIQ